MAKHSHTASVKGAITSKEIVDEIEDLKAKQINCIANYKDWAMLDVNYKVAGNLSDNDRKEVLQQNLKAHNDAYTVNMMTNCLSYLDRGLTLGNLAKSYFTYQTSKIVNGSMEDSEAKMWDSFRENLKPLTNNHPMLKVFLGPIDSYAKNKSFDKMNQSINKKFNNNDIDSLVMTPRQIAAIKLNFMEQYYFDVRKEDSSKSGYKDKIDDLTDKYNIAMQHIEAIAENNGFEMSSVAAEERYLVGLKMMENPEGHYENIFNEASSIYGAKPDFEHGMDIQISKWNGEFITSDGHSYMGDSRGSNGAFTVRPTLADPDKLNEFKLSLNRQGQEYAWMQMYLSSDKYCPADKSERQQALIMLEQKFNNYKESIKSQVKIDLNYSDKQSEEFIKNTFDKGFNSSMSKDVSFEDAITVLGSEGPGHLMDEIRYIKLSETLISEYKLPSDAFKNQQSSSLEKEGIDGATRMHNYFSDFCRRLRQNDSDYNKSNVDIMTDVVNMSVKNMEAHDLVDLMMHTGSNIEQGVRNGKFTDRQAIIQIGNENEDVLTEQEDPESMIHSGVINNEISVPVLNREGIDISRDENEAGDVQVDV